MRSSKAHTQFVLEYSLEWFVHRSWSQGRNVWFLTLTFEENVTDLGEAWKRFKPCGDWLRNRGIQAIGAWQQQKRGAWHAHLVINGFVDINRLREFLTHRGWGRFMRVDKIIWPPDAKQAKAEASRAIRYVTRYVGRDAETCQAAAMGHRVTIYVGKCKKGTVRFVWVGGLGRVWRLGCSLYCQAYGLYAWQLDWARRERNRQEILRMGLEEVFGEPGKSFLLEEDWACARPGPIEAAELADLCPF